METLIRAKSIFNKVWPKYNHIFYIEPEFDLIDDGVRSLDLKFRDEIADLFEMVIDKEKLSVTRIKGSVRDRVTTIINILEGR
jgi:nicotinamide riboside kinase